MFANIVYITLLCGDAKLQSRENRPTQCSPQSLAQQVRDHSLLERLKICTRGVLSCGAGGHISRPLLRILAIVRRQLKNLIPIILLCLQYSLCGCGLKDLFTLHTLADKVVPFH